MPPRLLLWALAIAVARSYCVTQPSLELTAVGAPVELAFDHASCRFTGQVPSCACSVQMALTDPADSYSVNGHALSASATNVALNREAEVETLQLTPASSQEQAVALTLLLDEASNSHCVGLTELLLLYSLPDTLVAPPVSPSFRECWKNYTVEVSADVNTLVLVLTSVNNATILVDGDVVYEVGNKNLLALSNATTTLTSITVVGADGADNDTYLLDIVRVDEPADDDPTSYVWAYWSAAVLAAALVPSAVLAVYCRRARKQLSDLEAGSAARLLHEEVEKTELPFDEITIMERITYGSRGLVYRGVFAGAQVAVKQLTGETSDEFEREADILRQLRHPFIMRFYGTTRTRSDRYIVMEYYPYSLNDFVRRKAAVDDKSFLQIASELGEGMAYLHARCILHRDLKPANVLLDAAGHVKICEFGLSTVVSQRSRPSVDPGGFAFDFSAPEAKEDEHQAGSDVYSYGLVLIVLRTLDPAPPAGHAVPENFPPKLRELLTSCLAADPAKRPDFPYILRLLQHGRLLEEPARLWTAEDWTSERLSSSESRSESPSIQSP